MQLIFISRTTVDYGLLSRFFKGVYRSKPPRARYETTWDPSIVLRYIETMFPLETLTLEQLSHRLITLLALGTGHRVQTFSKICLNNITDSEDRIEIFIPDIIKTSRPNRPQPCLLLPFFKDNPKLCLCFTLREYILRTGSLRPDGCNQLLITSKKPYRSATAQTLSRWIKSVLKKAGLDITKFKAHSTRHASTSSASRTGVDIDVIRKAAGWTSNSSTFARFYQRPLDDRHSFATSVLSNPI